MLNNMFSRRSFIAAVCASGMFSLALAGCGGSARGGSGGAEPGSAQADALARIKSKGVMTFGTEGTWSPWTFHAEDGTLTGYDIEVARELAARLGVEAKFAEGEWDGLLAGLDSGRYDTMANGVSVTSEREEKYTFTEPYAYNRIVVITTEDSGITSMKDFDGRMTANTLGSSYAALAEGYGATAMGVDDFNQTIELLLAGRVDATLNDEVVYRDYLAQHPESPLKIAAYADEPTSVALPLRKEDGMQPLIDAINEAIDGMREDGTLAEISNRFFGMDISAA